MVLSNVPEGLVKKAATPAADHLFKTNQHDPAKLDEDRAQWFHRIVMQLQYLSQHARPDIRTAVSFMCERVTKSDKDDWKKLGQLSGYLEDTIDLPLRLQVDESGEMHWYVDGVMRHSPCMMTWRS